MLFREVQLCQDRKSLWRFRGSALRLGCGNWQPRLEEQGRTMDMVLLASHVPIPNSLQSVFPNLLTPSGKSAIFSL